MYVLEVIKDARCALSVLEFVLCMIEAVKGVLYVLEVVKDARLVL